MSSHKLITADETRVLLADIANSEIAPVFLSAYFTRSAFEFFNTLQLSKRLSLAIRAQPRDFESGASDLDAVRQSLNADWDIRFISALHAKVYLIGDNMLIGSANLTSNGLHLLGQGNLELNCLVKAGEPSRNLVWSIFNQAQQFTPDLIERMEEFLETDRLSNHSSKTGW